MNPMDELRAARPAHYDEPVGAQTRQREIAYATSQPRTKKRFQLKPVWSISLAGAAAALTVMAVAVATGGTGTPVKPPIAGTTPSRTIEVADARAVLLAAAEKAETQPDTTGNWWHTANESRNLWSVKDADYNVYTLEMQESWTPLKTGGRSWGRQQKLGFTFPTDADKAAWLRAGSPSKIELLAPAPKRKGGVQMGNYTVDAAPGKAETNSSKLHEGDKVFWLGKNVTMKDLLSLPSDPAKLKAWLLRSYDGHGTESSSEPMASDDWLYAVSKGLIMSMPVKPKVRAAAFRMLADLKSVAVVDGVKDARGRVGTAVTINEKVKVKATDKKYSGEVQQRLIFDKETGLALQDDVIVVKPGGYSEGFKAGDFIQLNTVVKYGWVDERK